MTTAPKDQPTTGCFVSVHVSRPTLRTQLTWAELGLPDLDEALVSPPSTRPPSKEYNVFSRLESRMRSTLRGYSAGTNAGFRFMKYDKMRAFMEQVQPHIDAYEAAIDPFLASYEASVEAALADWDTKGREIYRSLKAPDIGEDEFVERLQAKLKRSWPAGSDLRSRFDARVEMMQIAIPNSADAQQVDPALMAAARRRAEQTLDSFFIEAQNELRQRAVDVVRRMHNVLVNGETVTERSINPLREFVAQFRELSVVDNDEFQESLDGVMRLIDDRGGAEGLRSNDDAWAQARDQLDSVAERGERLIAEATAKRVNLNRKVTL